MLHLRGYTAVSLQILAFVSAVFRVEIAALLASQSAILLLRKKLGFTQVVVNIFKGMILGICTSVAIDSFFWQELSWPEFESFIFNVAKGKSVEWGTEPWFFYFSNALPKSFMFLTPLVFIGCILYFKTALPYIIYISIMSIQGHKEWRFIEYALPTFTLLAARATVKM